MDCFDDFFGDVVHGGDENRPAPLLRHRMDAFADEALAADWIFVIMCAVVSETPGGAFEGLVAVGETDDQKGIGPPDSSCKCFRTGKSVKEEVVVAGVGTGAPIRSNHAHHVQQWLAPEIPHDLVFVVFEQVPQCFPAQVFSSGWTNAGECSPVPDSP